MKFSTVLAPQDGSRPNGATGPDGDGAAAPDRYPQGAMARSATTATRCASCRRARRAPASASIAYALQDGVEPAGGRQAGGDVALVSAQQPDQGAGERMSSGPPVSRTRLGRRASLRSAARRPASRSRGQLGRGGRGRGRQRAHHQADPRRQLGQPGPHQVAQPAHDPVPDAPSRRPPCSPRSRPAGERGAGRRPTCTTSRARPLRRPRRMTSANSSRWVSRDAAGNTGTAGQAERRTRPLPRRAAMMARPARVRIRSRKPCVRARRRLFG